MLVFHSLKILPAARMHLMCHISFYKMSKIYFKNLYNGCFCKHYMYWWNSLGFHCSIYTSRAKTFIWFALTTLFLLFLPWVNQEEPLTFHVDIFQVIVTYDGIHELRVQNLFWTMQMQCNIDPWFTSGVANTLWVVSIS